MFMLKRVTCDHFNNDALVIGTELCFAVAYARQIVDTLYGKTWSPNCPSKELRPKVADDLSMTSSVSRKSFWPAVYGVGDHRFQPSGLTLRQLMTELVEKNA